MPHVELSKEDDRRLRAYALAGWRHREDGYLPTGPEYMARVEIALDDILESERIAVRGGNP